MWKVAAFYTEVAETGYDAGSISAFWDRAVRFLRKYIQVSDPRVRTFGRQAVTSIAYFRLVTSTIPSLGNFWMQRMNPQVNK